MLEFIVDVFKYAVAIVLSGIIVSVVPVLRDFLVSKFKLSLDKQLEKSKAANERKNYVSKVRFDAEFEIYRSLSKSFNKMVRSIFELNFYYKNRKLDVEKIITASNKVTESVDIAQNNLYENACFIPEKIYKTYEDMLYSCNVVITDWYKLNGENENVEVTPEKFDEEVRIMCAQLAVLNNEVREYLSKLEALN